MKKVMQCTNAHFVLFGDDFEEISMFEIVFDDFERTAALLEKSVSFMEENDSLTAVMLSVASFQWAAYTLSSNLDDEDLEGKKIHHGLDGEHYVKIELDRTELERSFKVYRDGYIQVVLASYAGGELVAALGNLDKLKASIVEV